MLSFWLNTEFCESEIILCKSQIDNCHKVIKN